MTSITDKWNDRFPDGYIVGDLSEADLSEWRQGARQDEANGYVRPHTTTPSKAAQVAIPREMQHCPSLDWSRGRNPHAQIGERSAWKPLKE